MTQELLNFLKLPTRYLLWSGKKPQQYMSMNKHHDPNTHCMQISYGIDSYLIIILLSVIVMTWKFHILITSSNKNVSKVDSFFGSTFEYSFIAFRMLVHVSIYFKLCIQNQYQWIIVTQINSGLRNSQFFGLACTSYYVLLQTLILLGTKQLFLCSGSHQI